MTWQMLQHFSVTGSLACRFKKLVPPGCIPTLPCSERLGLCKLPSCSAETQSVRETARLGKEKGPTPHSDLFNPAAGLHGSCLPQQLISVSGFLPRPQSLDHCTPWKHQQPELVSVPSLEDEVPSLQGLFCLPIGSDNPQKSGSPRCELCPLLPWTEGPQI